MTKAAATTKTIREQIAQAVVDGTTKTDRSAVAALANEARNVMTNGTAELTCASVQKNIADGLALISQAFVQMEQRLIGDNGKRYPLDATLPAGVEDTGSIELVNKYGFIERSLVGSLCWKLESMVDGSAERISMQHTKIKAAVRQIETGRTDVAIVERMADYLESMEEQHCLLIAAYQSALDSHAGILGEDYETKAMRADRAKAAPAHALPDRLARFR